MQRAIQPVICWYNGKNEDANVFSMITISDNLLDTAVFYYQLIDDDSTETPPTQTQLAQGNLTLGPDEYPNWDGSNDWIMNWAASQLNLVFLPESILTN
jgi:hypothetical protein